MASLLRARGVHTRTAQSTLPQPCVQHLAALGSFDELASDGGGGAKHVIAVAPGFATVRLPLRTETSHSRWDRNCGQSDFSRGIERDSAIGC